MIQNGFSHHLKYLQIELLGKVKIRKQGFKLLPLPLVKLEGLGLLDTGARVPERGRVPSLTKWRPPPASEPAL